jgi:hypothetical protein
VDHFDDTGPVENPVEGLRVGEDIRVEQTREGYQSPRTDKLGFEFEIVLGQLGKLLAGVSAVVLDAEWNRVYQGIHSQCLFASLMRIRQWLTINR